VLRESIRLRERLMEDEAWLHAEQGWMQRIAELMQQGGTMYIAGNGGSHCDACHFAEELTGRYAKDRRPLAALALGEASHMSCVANDFGFEWVFARQIEALGRPGDGLILLSTSGVSPNLLRAAEVAGVKGLETFALLGRAGEPLGSKVRHPLRIPGVESARIQELMMMILHATVAWVEEALGLFSPPAVVGKAPEALQ
jgi:D-sedoheptulose 7-phosphate isomerase